MGLWAPKALRDLGREVAAAGTATAVALIARASATAKPVLRRDCAHLRALDRVMLLG